MISAGWWNTGRQKREEQTRTTNSSVKQFAKYSVMVHPMLSRPVDASEADRCGFEMWLVLSTQRHWANRIQANDGWGPDRHRGSRKRYILVGLQCTATCLARMVRGTLIFPHQLVHGPAQSRCGSTCAHASVWLHGMVCLQHVAEALFSRHCTL